MEEGDFGKDIPTPDVDAVKLCEDVTRDTWKHMETPCLVAKSLFPSIDRMQNTKKKTEVLVLFGLIAATWPRVFLTPREV